MRQRYSAIPRNQVDSAAQAQGVRTAPAAARAVSPPLRALLPVLCLLLALLAGCTSFENAVSAKSEPAPTAVMSEESAPAAVARTEAKAKVMAKVFSTGGAQERYAATPVPVGATRVMMGAPPPRFNTESYDRVNEGRFLEVMQHPLSTFSIDVDTASYANVRRYLSGGSLPPQDAVRIEELINYFSYDYPDPKGTEPFSFTTELTDAPWRPGHQLLRIGLQGRKIPLDQLPPANLVFLVDVSGSMSDDNKLPLLVRSFKLLVNELRPVDRVAIVVYAGEAGVVLPPTSGRDKEKILAALDSLRAGGSTAGGEGLKLAYAVAREHFQPKGNNRIILATDGDFNVGASSDGELVRMIEEMRKGGIFLSVLGFGMGNYKDATMQKLADHGNGNYAYVDSLLEAKKVLVSQMGGTLFTIAKDVKLQVEFNPARVKAYRLIGYEKRMLNREDFSDDRKDAGELGSGHTVTAIYEIVPAGAALPPADNLTYQTTRVKEGAGKSPDLATIRFRYKEPQSEVSKELVKLIPASTVAMSKAAESMKFAAAVAQWGMLLSGSEFKGSASFPAVLDLARQAKGSDERGLRAEFIRLVEMSELLARSR